MGVGVDLAVQCGSQLLSEKSESGEGHPKVAQTVIVTLACMSSFPLNLMLSLARLVIRIL